MSSTDEPPSEESLTDPERCELEPFSNHTDVIRMILISGIGSVICVMGIALNALLLLLFSRLSFRNTNYLYLYILAFCDIIVEICFVLLFSVNTFFEYFESYELYYVWHQYIRGVSTVGQVLILASSVIIVLASFERYQCSSSKSVGFEPATRRLLIAGVLIYALLVKGTVYAELQVSHYADCPPFADWQLQQSELASPTSLYFTIWMFHGRNLLSVGLPFLLLCVLNFLTFHNMNRKSKHFEAMLLEGPTMLLPQDAQQALAARDRKRDATATLFTLVSVYLISNFMNAGLLFWEYIDKNSLMRLGNGWPYRYMADMSSILSTFATAIRLPIYWACNRELRDHMHRFLREFIKHSSSADDDEEKDGFEHEVMV